VPAASVPAALRVPLRRCVVIGVDSPFVAPARIERGTFERVLRAAGSPWAGRAGEIHDLIVALGHDPAAWLAICAEEHSYGTNRDSVLWRNDTRSWTNARTVRDPSITGWSLVYDSVRRSTYVRYADVRDSVRDGCYRISDPTYRYAREGRRTLAEVFAIWTEGDGARYAANVVKRINGWIADEADEEETVGGDDARFAWVPDRYSEYGYPEQGRPGRSGRTVDLLILHITDGVDSLDWLVDDHASSAHYLTWPDGTPRAQMVREANAAWTAGNRAYNERAINVEHEKLLFTGDDYTAWSDAEYRNLAATCWPILRRHPGIPLEHPPRGSGRPGIIGHDDVPDPGGRGYGGAGNHVDPGPRFDWERFLVELRRVARDDGVPRPPHVTDPTARVFPETGRWIQWSFKAHWEANPNALMDYGYPLTDEVTEDGTSVQYFERAVFEWHPANAAPYRVLLRRLGAAALVRRAA
jgi:hypothetical protein